jgi:hypothetical protein
VADAIVFQIARKGETMEKIWVFTMMCLAAPAAGWAQYKAKPKKDICQIAFERQAPKVTDLKDLSPVRQQILDLAEAQIGQVKDARGEDGFKIGWQKLVDFYNFAWDKEWAPAVVKLLKTVGKTPPQPRSWCGIFGTWVVRKVRQKNNLPDVKWGLSKQGGGPQGFEGPCTDIKNVLPGDIVVFKGQLVHHAVVEQVQGKKIQTIDGNMMCQQIHRTVRPLKEVAYYYRTVPIEGQECQIPAFFRATQKKR